MNKTFTTILIIWFGIGFTVYTLTRDLNFQIFYGVWLIIETLLAIESANDY
jgi:hypothetical protein